MKATKRSFTVTYRKHIKNFKYEDTNNRRRNNEYSVTKIKVHVTSIKFEF